MRVSSALRSAEAPPLAKWITSLTIVLYSAWQTFQLFYCSGDYRIISLARIIALPVLFYCPGDYRIILLPGDYRIILLPR